MGEVPAEDDGTTARPADDRLESWKDVAAYLRRDVRTVQRWEQREGLPIHRQQHDKLGSIFAFRQELDEWRAARSRRLGSSQEDASVSSVEIGESESDSGINAGPEPGLPHPQSSRERVRLLLATSAAVVIVAIFASWLTRRPASEPSPEIRSIVVLPLENLSGDATQDFFAAGLTEEITARLAQLKTLRVVSRTSAMTLKDRKVPVSTIAREFGVDAVVEGSVRREGAHVRISIQLVHAPTDTHLWARDFEREATSALSLQSEVAQAVANEMRVESTPEERERLAAVPPVNPAAHEEYLLGRHLLWKFIEGDRVAAIEHFNRAINLDPNYAAPYAALAHTWWMRAIFGPLSLKAVATPLRDAALAALSRDDRNVEAYAALAYAEGMFDWDWKRAEATVQRAVGLEPNSVDAHYIYAMLLMAMGRLSDSLSQIDSASKLDPLSAQVQSTYGRILYRARRFDDARLRLERALELEPRNTGIYGRLAEVHEQLAHYDRALALLDKMDAVSPTSPKRFAEARARILALAGRTGEARQLLSQLSLQDGERAEVFAALGDPDAAFSALFRAVSAHDASILFIKKDPIFDNLHSDSRWNEVLRRMNLSD